MQIFSKIIFIRILFLNLFFSLSNYLFCKRRVLSPLSYHLTDNQGCSLITLCANTRLTMLRQAPQVNHVKCAFGRALIPVPGGHQYCHSVILCILRCSALQSLTTHMHKEIYKNVVLVRPWRSPGGGWANNSLLG